MGINWEIPLQGLGRVLLLCPGLSAQAEFLSHRTSPGAARDLHHGHSM